MILPNTIVHQVDFVFCDFVSKMAAILFVVNTAQLQIPVHNLTHDNLSTNVRKVIRKLSKGVQVDVIV